MLSNFIAIAIALPLIGFDANMKRDIVIVYFVCHQFYLLRA